MRACREIVPCHVLSLTTIVLYINQAPFHKAESIYGGKQAVYGRS